MPMKLNGQSSVAFRFASSQAPREAFEHLRQEKDLCGLDKDCNDFEVRVHPSGALCAETVFAREKLKFQRHPLYA